MEKKENNTINKEKAEGGITELIKRFNTVARQRSLQGVERAENYTNYFDYIQELRARLSTALYIYTTEFFKDLSDAKMRLELELDIMESEKYIYYEDYLMHEENGGYSKSQADSKARKMTKTDEEYINLRQRCNDAVSEFYSAHYLKDTVKETLNSMSNYKDV